MSPEWRFRIAEYSERRLYPIVMFCQHDPDIDIPIGSWKQQFEYDAFEMSHLYTNIEKYGEKFLSEPQFSVKNLKKIYRDIVREDEMQDMESVFVTQEDTIKSTGGDGVKFLDKRPPKFEFHIACLCYDKKNNKYWITNHNTHGWSFGCVGITQNSHYYESVIEAYKMKYNLEIKLNECNPIISFYSTDRKQASLGSILGVVILVTDVSGTGEKEGIESGWYSCEELKQFDGQKKLSNFEQILNKAQLILKRA